MITCFEYLGCKKKDCPAFQNNCKKPCWEVKGTHCNIPAAEKIIEDKGSKLEFCKVCIYYKYRKEFL